MGAFSGTLSVTVHGNLESQWTLQREWTDFSPLDCSRWQEKSIKKRGRMRAYENPKFLLLFCMEKEFSVFNNAGIKFTPTLCRVTGGRGHFGEVLPHCTRSYNAS